jgi:hypothetical protein
MDPLTELRIMRAAARADDLKGLERRVLVLVLEGYNAKHGYAWPSHDRLATELNASRRGCIAAVQGLLKKGWIECVRRGGGRNTANRYVPVWTRGDRVRTTDKPSNEIGQPAAESAGPAEDIDEAIEAEVVDDVEVAFASFRQRFPHRSPAPTEKHWSDARTEFTRIVKAGEATADAILAGAARYRTSREGEEARYTKNPANWLKECGWTAEYAAKQLKKPAGRTGGGTSSFDQAFMNVAERLK